MRGLSLLFLPFTDFTFFGLSLFAVFYGLDWIATVPPTVKLTAQTFGAERANLVFGWIFAGHQIGAAIAAFIVLRIVGPGDFAATSSPRRFRCSCVSRRTRASQPLPADDGASC